MIGRNPASNFKESKKINPISCQIILQYKDKDKVEEFLCATRMMLRPVTKWSDY